MMFLPSPTDALHKAWLYRVLTAFADDATIARALAFKGGTCAAMRGLLDRFSVDLDFDYMGIAADLPDIRSRMERTFTDLTLTIADASKKVPQYFLKYPSAIVGRNTMKIDVTMPPPRANIYEPVRLLDIDRIITCQTVETMFANKLVALIERSERHDAIAGRDVYDLHHFFSRGFRYADAVIRERRGVPLPIFFAALIAFVERHVTQTIIDQDINTLLLPDRFRAIRKTLKQEVLMFLRDEHARLVHGDGS